MGAAGTLPKLEPYLSRGRARGGFESSQGLPKEQRAKVSAGSEGSSSMESMGGWLLPRSKKSSFPGTTRIPWATRIDLTWFYLRACIITQCYSNSSLAWLKHRTHRHDGVSAPTMTVPSGRG